MASERDTTGTAATDREPAARNPVLPQTHDGPIPSSELLQGRCCLEISHNGMVYRLHVTRMGKLILTK